MLESAIASLLTAANCCDFTVAPLTEEELLGLALIASLSEEAKKNLSSGTAAA